MEVAVFSDIHGNYVAFQSCLEYALKRNINTFVLLGDYIGEFPYPQKAMELLYTMQNKYQCFFIRGNKEDYWINHKNSDIEWKSGTSSTGALSYCFSNLKDKDIEFISMDYDKERVIKEMRESGLMELAPYWNQITVHLMLTGELSHGTVLAKAMEYCKKDTGNCIWYDIPEIYWEKAIREFIDFGSNMSSAINM